MRATIADYPSEPIDRHGPDAMMLFEFEADGDSVTADVMVAPFLQVVLERLPALADGDSISFELDAGELRFEPDDGEIEIRSTQDRSPEGGPIRADRRAVTKACIELAEEFHRRLSDSEYSDEGYAQSLGEKIAETKRRHRAKFE